MQPTVDQLSLETARLGEQVAWNGFSGAPQLLTAYRLAQLPPPYNPAQGGICQGAPLRPETVTTSFESGGLGQATSPDDADLALPGDALIPDPGLDADPSDPADETGGDR